MGSICMIESYKMKQNFIKLDNTQIEKIKNSSPEKIQEKEIFTITNNNKEPDLKKNEKIMIKKKRMKRKKKKRKKLLLKFLLKKKWKIIVVIFVMKLLKIQ